MSDDRCERVVEDAVGDEAVAPGVPEVVPGRQAVLEEERPLVEMGGKVGAGRSQREQGAGHDCRAESGNHRFAGRSRVLGLGPSRHRPARASACPINMSTRR
jgi:hypothetical protein